MRQSKPRRSLWARCERPTQSAEFRLFCFPSAGAGSSLFRGWAKALPERIETWTVQLPGREERFGEASSVHLPDLIESLAIELTPYFDVPFALFGHSMGALLSFECARRLRAIGVSPVSLLVSSCAAPHLPDREGPLHTLPDDELWAWVRALGGTAVGIFTNSEVLEIYLPLLRADLALCDSYVYASDAPLSCPVTAFGGRDDPKVTEADLESWKGHTCARFTLTMFKGGHFFITENRATFLRWLSESLLDSFEISGSRPLGLRSS